MYITDHQLNLESGSRFGETRATVPLVATPHIHCGNALRMDWNSVVKAEDCNYVFGNPPFIGHQWRTAEQVEDMKLVWGTDGKFGRLDYVTCWYKRCADYLQINKSILCAFVSTNSIAQGEQVSTLWSYLISKGTYINFAHQSFKWSNEGRGIAGVHCVIIGFSKFDNKHKKLFSYPNGLAKDYVLHLVGQINPYLVNAPTILLPSRVPVPKNTPLITQGSKPVDGGYLILSEEEKLHFLDKYPNMKSAVRLFLGGEELINNKKRYCLWLKDVSPELLNQNNFIKERLAGVKKTRLQSPTLSVQEFASTPYLFTQDRQPDISYIAIPEVSSEKRSYIPIAYLSKDVIASNKIFMLLDDDLLYFSILCSSMHNSWMRTVCGRLESRYSYAPAIFYNLPKIENITEDLAKGLRKSAQIILDARNAYPNASLADLYDDLTMPVELLKAHEANNKAVDEAYRYKGDDDDASRVAFLFKRYEELTSLLPATTVKKKRAKKTNDGELLI